MWLILEFDKAQTGTRDTYVLISWILSKEHGKHHCVTVRRRGGGIKKIGRSFCGRCLTFVRRGGGWGGGGGLDAVSSIGPASVSTTFCPSASVVNTDSVEIFVFVTVASTSSSAAAVAFSSP